MARSQFRQILPTGTAYTEMVTDLDQGLVVVQNVDNESRDLGITVAEAAPSDDAAATVKLAPGESVTILNDQSDKEIYARSYDSAQAHAEVRYIETNVIVALS